MEYSIVKDSIADLGVNFKIVQNRPTDKAVCTKISKSIFPYLSILLIIQGCPDRVIKSITIKPNILQKTLFHRFSPKFIKV